jgi:putative aminophosphonate oxidoreductase
MGRFQKMSGKPPLPHSNAKTVRPYWLDEALKLEGEQEITPLKTDIVSDVCIVGGGYTGLWTALMLKEQDPDIKITIIEKEICGYGASGSNGGCVLTLATKYFSLCRFYGQKEAKRLVTASEEAVQKIKQYTEEHRIDCDLRIDGTQYIATNEAQVGAMDEVVHALNEEGLSNWVRQSLEKAVKFAGTHEIREAFFSPNAGSVQPALLLRGLVRVAREKGIQIYEHTPMNQILSDRDRPKVMTPEGSIDAGKVVLAINAWMASKFRQFSRSIVVVSSDMAITEPVPKRLEEVGLNHGATICDSRTFVHYYHTTSHGRLLFGKGGNTFAYGSKMLSLFFQASAYLPQLKKAIERFFPTFKSTNIAQTWTGGSDRSTTGFPFFGNLNEHPNIHYGLGYSGNGVTQSWLGGRILCSLCLNRDDEWSRCGFVGGPRGYFPPEPIRWMGSMMVRNAIRRKEAAEDAGVRPNIYDSLMARFAKSAGKTDKKA